MPTLLPENDHLLPDHFRRALADFAAPLYLVRSPGRINIIGEHTDYNGGWVLPAAIEQGIYFAVRLSQDGQFHFRALDLDQAVSFSALPTRKTGTQWVDYLLGVTDQFRQRGYPLPPIDLLFGGDLPQGAGVSSSAALEGGMAFLLNLLTKAGLPRPELAELCHHSSNQFMGIPSGIMDQFASLNGRKDRAILLNCNTLDHEFIKADFPDHRFVLINSMVTHEHGSSEYPVRVAECREGLEVLQRHYPKLQALAHATPEMLLKVRAELRPVVFQRCRFVIGETIRTTQAVRALQARDALALGQQLNLTHAGLRDDYAVSCPEIDFLQDFAVAHPAVTGSRLMGGGFGGCTLNLVRVTDIQHFRREIGLAYHTAFGREPGYFEVQLSKGTCLLTPPPF